MQLVVMAAVLVVVGARQRCESSCRPTGVMMQVEACRRQHLVYTNRCEGQCYHEDPVYLSKMSFFKQHICTGNWTYVVTNIDGCDEEVVVPVATECSCSLCNPEDTECGGFARTPTCSID